MFCITKKRIREPDISHTGQFPYQKIAQADKSPTGNYPKRRPERKRLATVNIFFFSHRVFICVPSCTNFIINKACRYNWHSAGSLGWPVPMLKYRPKYIFQIIYAEAILSNSTRKLLSFEISKLLIAVLKIHLFCHLL